MYAQAQTFEQYIPLCYINKLALREPQTINKPLSLFSLFVVYVTYIKKNRQSRTYAVHKQNTIIPLYRPYTHGAIKQP